MPRYGETIRKRKEGRWEVRSKIGNGKSEKTLNASVYRKTYVQVKEKFNEALICNSNEKEDYISKGNFSSAVEQWFSHKKIKLKKSSVHKYEYIIKKHILPSLGGIKMSDINVSLLNDFAEKKLENGSAAGEKGLSRSYVRSMMLIISSVIEYAFHEGWCKPFFSKIYKPTQNKKDLRILSITEQQSLEKTLISNLSQTSIGMLITLHTGLRIGEICALSWEDVDFINNIIYVRGTVSRIKNPIGSGTVLIIDTPKTEASRREIPFTNELKNLLSIIKKQSVSKYVVSDKPNFLSPRTFEYRYHKIMQQINLPEINYHALRHTFATRCIECGVDVKSLSEILGHSNVSTTLNTYVHSSINLKRIQLDKLPVIPC